MRSSRVSPAHLHIYIIVGTQRDGITNGSTFFHEKRVSEKKYDLSLCSHKFYKMAGDIFVLAMGNISSKTATDVVLDLLSKKKAWLIYICGIYICTYHMYVCGNVHSYFASNTSKKHSLCVAFCIKIVKLFCILAFWDKSLSKTCISKVTRVSGTGWLPLVKLTLSVWSVVK